MLQIDMSLPCTLYVVMLVRRIPATGVRHALQLVRSCALLVTQYVAAQCTRCWHAWLMQHVAGMQLRSTSISRRSVMLLQVADQLRFFSQQLLPYSQASSQACLAAATNDASLLPAPAQVSLSMLRSYKLPKPATGAMSAAVLHMLHCSNLI